MGDPNLLLQQRHTPVCPHLRYDLLKSGLQHVSGNGRLYNATITSAECLKSSKCRI